MHLGADLWKELGLGTTILDAACEDRSGSVVLEILLREDVDCMPGYTNIYRQELIAMTAWYIWWARQRKTHDETGPPIPECAMSIKALVANHSRVNLPSSSCKRHGWSQLLSGHVKFNVEATFNADDLSGGCNQP
jgi:hypothetical protein